MVQWDPGSQAMIISKIKFELGLIHLLSKKFIIKSKVLYLTDEDCEDKSIEKEGQNK